jgi:hypothetical protein
LQVFSRLIHCFPGLSTLIPGISGFTPGFSGVTPGFSGFFRVFPGGLALHPPSRPYPLCSKRFSLWFSRYLEKVGKTWKRLETPGNTWKEPGKTRKTLDSSWKGLEKPGINHAMSCRPYLSHSLPSQTLPPMLQKIFLMVFQVPGKSRKNLEKVGKAWKYLEIPGNTWKRVE